MTKEQYLSWFDEVVKPTEALFHRVPADKVEFKLTETSFTIGQQLAHIPASLGFIAMVVAREKLPLNSMREILVANRRQHSVGVEQGIELLKRSVEAFKGAVAKLSEEEFQDGLIDTPQKGRVPYWRYCAFTLEHHIHHLMELHLNLKVLGVDVNTKSLYVG